MKQKGEIFYVGVDGGGTHCRARLTDHHGQVLGEGVSGSANVYSDAEGAVVSILDAIRKALHQAGLDEQAFSRLHLGLGLAGAEMRVAKSFLGQWRHPFAKLAHASDAHIACLGAHAGKNGSILIIGTGICGWSIIGEQHSSWSGWGFPFADQGSGAWLGLRLYQLTLQALDGVIAASDLTHSFAADFDFKAEAIVQFYRNATPASFAKLAPLVVQNAAQNDSNATSILAEQQSIIQALIKSMHDFNDQPVVLMGGLAEIVKQNLAAEYQSWIADSKGDALSGALQLARTAP
ncbi:BadF/BadG/BcrA/BcrD ATPase family protein [Marinomonas sp. THO17]|uniref:BadF/BadG/BcrA/BcrD ATPase family protein n=1 Tax=Marinomonas sp. THO17 TaxID=3149048 RepID=UPI00336BF2C2